MKIAIIGFGREGQSAYQWLKKRPEYAGAELWVLDKNSAITIPSDVHKQTGQSYLDGLSRFDLIVRSPGVPYTLVQSQIKGEAAKITSATKLFFEHCPCLIIGITGTKGKGTTATIIYNILKMCGHDAYLVGNIGKSPLTILPRLTIQSCAVLELSSFQLQDLDRSPRHAVVLDIFPDHLDSHANFKEYLVSKAHIAWNQKPGDAVFYFADNEHSSWIAHRSEGKRISIYHAINYDDREKLRAHVRIPGRHNWRNIQAAFAAARSLGCPKNKILKAIAAFRGNEHRLELARTLRGIAIYNDSASTNPETTAAAVRAFPNPKILIAGGKDKNLDYTIWNREFAGQKIKQIVLYGADREKMKNALRGTLLKKTIMADTLNNALRAAYAAAKRGYAIIFSPGAASFDMFKNYAHRGATFKRLVKKLK